MIFRKYALTLAAAICITSHMAGAATWYVSGKGNDNNTGLSPSQAFRTLQTAAGHTQPGDTVMAMNGTYRPPGPGGDVLDITTSGTPAAWITYQAAPGESPLIDFSRGWNGIQVDAAYVVIQGFELAGGAQHVTLRYAQAHENDLSNYRTSANGILIANFINGTTSHHIVIQDNEVHDSPGAGIASCYADYITIRHNETYRNAYWSPYANSGISIWEMRDIDDNTGYKNFILDNLAYRNQEFIPFYVTGTITDGNGIIVDDNKNTQSNNVPYHGRTYVADNIVWLNGGSGIHTYDSGHVDIVYNTAYLNNQTPSINEGQMFASSADDVNVLNNIAVAPPMKVYYSSFNNDATVRYDYNLLYRKAASAAPSAGPVVGPHDLVANPMFVAPGDDNFQLTVGSQAIFSASAEMAPATDFAGNPRPSPNGGYDRGAYQYVAPGGGNHTPR